MSACVRGYGCWPITDAAKCTGAGVRKPPGKEPTERLGTAGAALTCGDLSASDQVLERADAPKPAE
jgi:hypothetical protein